MLPLLLSNKADRSSIMLYFMMKSRYSDPPPALSGENIIAILDKHGVEYVIVMDSQRQGSRSGII